MGAVFTLEGSGSGAVKVVEAVNAALDKTGKAAEGAAKSTKQLTNEAQRIKESIDPQEKLNRLYRDLQKHVDDGRISIGQATAAGIKYRQELYAASEQGKAAGEQAKRRGENERKSLAIQLEAGRAVVRVEKERAAAAAQATREEQQLVAAALKIKEAINPQEKMNRLYKELGQHVQAGRLTIEQATAAGVKYQRELDGVARAGKQAFGPSALSELGSYLTSFLSISAAIGLATKALRENANERQLAAQKAMQSRAGLGSLSQLAATMGKTPTERDAAFASLVAEARGLVTIGAAADENEAGNLLFQLAGAGLNRRDRRFAAELRAAGSLTNVGGAAQAYDALVTALGEKEVGTFRQFSSKAIEAAAIAPGSFEQLPIALTTAGSSARRLGISDEFLLAAGTILAKSAGSPTEGATQLGAFLKQAEKSGLKGLEGIGGIAVVEKIAALPKSQQGYGGVLGDRQEAVSGFSTLALPENLAKLRELEGTITKAQSIDLAGETARLPGTDPTLRAAMARAQAEGDLAVAQVSGLSQRENLIAALRAERRAAMAEQGRGTYARGTVESIEDILGLDAEIHRSRIQLEENRAAGLQSPFSEKTTALLEEYLKRTAEASEKTQQQQRSKSTTRAE